PVARSLANAAARQPIDAGTDRALDGLVDLLADRIASVVSARLSAGVLEQPTNEWLDSREAAAHLGVHRDTLRRLAAERAIPSEQDGPGCKLYFLRDDLDAWRGGGGRFAQLAAVA
ncbi:MAG: helix-turn-helix domain-containing protein, partial [Solirubrobacteraceae bacterium]